MRHPLAFAGLVAVVALAGRSLEAQHPASPPSPTAIALVPANERSKQFEAVSRHLELGGTLYGFVDLDGDGLKLADSLQDWIGQMASTAPLLGPAAAQDYRAIFTGLGANDIKAIGFSSVPDASGGFRNRAYFYTPAGRHGLLAILGGPPSPFMRTRMAPADADFYSETEFDLPAAYATVKAVVAKIGGQAAADAFEEKLKAAGAQAGLSVWDVVRGLKGRLVVTGRWEPQQTFVFPGAEGLTIPKCSLLICIDGVGQAVETMLAKSPGLIRSEHAGRHYYYPKAGLPVAGLEPVMMVDGPALYLATSGTFLDECLARTAGLDQNPEFKRLLADLGPEGNGLGYMTPRFSERLRALPGLNPHASSATQNVMAVIARIVPAVDRPVMTIRQNLPDGVLVRARDSRSSKRALMLSAIYNPVTLSLIGVIAGLEKNGGSTALFTGAYPPRSPDAALAAVTPDALPEPIYRPGPTYPFDLRLRDVEGYVLVEFWIDAAGKTQNVCAVISPDPAFSAAAEQAIAAWRFRPARSNGQPVATGEMMIPINFTLEPSNLPPTASDDATQYYNAVMKQWNAVASRLAGRPNVTLRPAGRDALLWARIGVDERGNPIVEDAGHGVADPASIDLRRVLEQTFTGHDFTDSMRKSLWQSQHLDIGVPSIAMLIRQSHGWGSANSH